MKKKITDVVIESKEDADRVLAQIAGLRLIIQSEENSANERIDEIRAELVRETQGPREALGRHELALMDWAARNKTDLFAKSRSLELNFGRLGFRWTPYKIAVVGKLKVASIIARIRAAKLPELIHTKETVNRKVALNYSDEDLARCGLKKTRREEFFYEVKEEEVR